MSNVKKIVAEVMRRTLNTYFLGLREDNLQVASALIKSCIEQLKAREPMAIKINEKLNEIFECEGITITNIDMLNVAINIMSNFALAHLRRLK